MQNTLCTSCSTTTICYQRHSADKSSKATSPSQMRLMWILFWHLKYTLVTRGVENTYILVKLPCKSIHQRELQVIFNNCKSAYDYYLIFLRVLQPRTRRYNATREGVISWGIRFRKEMLFLLSFDVIHQYLLHLMILSSFERPMTADDDSLVG